MTRSAVGLIAPVVYVAGSELGGDTLRSLIGVRVSAGLRIPARAVLEFRDTGYTISASTTFKLGADVKIKTVDGDVLFTGEVTGVELDVERGSPILCVTADDAAYKMTLGNRVRTFTETSYSSVVSDIAREYGLKANCTAISSVQKYLLQTDSDFGFISEVADRVGYDWWIDASGELQFHPMGAERGSPTTVDWESGPASLRHFSVRASALHPQKVTATGWDADSRHAITSEGSTKGKQPDSELVKPYLKPRSLAKNSEVATAYRMFNKKADGDAFADSLATRSAAGSVVASGLCRVNPKIMVGHQVSVKDVGPASGTYQVTEVEHIYGAGGFDTRFTAGDREPTSLADTLSAPPTSSFRQDALVVGLVTNLGDNESPKGHVKVKFPTLGDNIESAWARVVSMGAGDSRGMTFLPEVNDEVIIAFEGGDISRPLVLGGLYSGAGAALDYGADQGTISKRQIVSRLGHVIELGDGTEAADQHIWLTLKGGEFALRLGKDGLTAKVPDGQPLSLSAGNSSITINNKGEIVLDGKKITLKSQGDVNISGVNVTSKGDSKVEASGAQVSIKGTTKAELTSGGQTSVKGTQVMIN